MPVESIATWPCGSLSPAKMSAAGAGMVRLISLRSVMSPRSRLEQSGRESSLTLRRRCRLTSVLPIHRASWLRQPLALCLARHRVLVSGAGNDRGREGASSRFAARSERGEESAMGDTSESREGTQFGPYTLRRLVGRGGMGDVYEAEDTVRERIVALKLMSQ